MNVPKLRFKEFNDEYAKLKYKDVLKIKSGKDQKQVEDENGKYPILGTGGQIGKTNSFLYDKPSVLIGRKGTINKPQYMESPFWTVDTLFYSHIYEPNIPKYLFYSFQNVNWKKYDESTGVPSLSSSTIESVECSIPSPNEQIKVANFLSLLDKKIELQSKKIEDLKLFKKGLIYNEKRNNNSWNEYKISNIMNITRGIVIPKTEISECINNEFKYPVYSSQTSNNGILGYDNKYDFNGKFLTWTTDGANAGKVFYREGKFRCTNVCGILYNKDNRYVSELTAELLNIETPKYVSYVGNPKLMNNVMSNIIIKLPDPSRDYFFSSILKIINKKLTIEEKKFDKLFELKKGFMQNMFV